MRTVGLLFIGVGVLIGLVYTLSGLSLASDFGAGVLIQTVIDGLFRGGVLSGIGILIMLCDASEQNSAGALELLQRIGKRRRE